MDETIKRDSKKKEIHIVNLVWGKGFLDLFLKITLPNQLTDKNLIFLSNQINVNVIYKIYTTDKDKKIIEASESYQKLSKYLKVEFELIALKDEFKYVTMNSCHNEALKNAFIKNAILVFLTADMICSNNLFKALYEYIMKGYRCIAVAGIRLSKQKFLYNVLKEAYTIDLPPRKLVKYALENLHAGSKALFARSNNIPSIWCSHFYYALGNNNLLARCFHLHPLLIWPEKKINLTDPIDANLIRSTIKSKNKIKVIEDSDDLVLFELTDNDEIDVYGKSIKRKFFYIANWCTRYTHNFNKFFIKHRIYFKSSDLDPQTKKIENQSDTIINKIFLLYKMFYVFFKFITFLRLFKNIILNKMKKIIKYPFSKLRSFLLRCPSKRIFYESKIAPFLAKYFFWAYWPIYKIFKVMRFCFIMNIAGGVGHIVLELDYFIRRLHSKEIDTSRRYIWIRLPDTYNETCINLYGKYFWYSKCDTMMYQLLLPILIYYKDITLDAGLSRLKWQLTDDMKYYKPLPGQTYLHQISKQKNFANFCNYIKVRKKTHNITPLKVSVKNVNKKLKNLIKTDKKIALIHLKESVCNATAQATDPSTYLETLKCLENLNFQLVFVGREKMPEVFHNFSIINYAQSDIANFKNDIELFNMAALAIISGSGIAYIADCIDLPYLYINTWHVQYCQVSSNCIIIPSLVKNKKTNQLLTISEQIDLYDKLEDRGAEIFPFNEFIVKNVASDEILEGLKELLNFKEEYQNYLQSKIKEKHFIIKNTSANFSNYFLNKYSQLL